ncbi:DUF185-domain-containing protein [Xylona heveae TC161]|uniref:Protein arginine methyltransferase NDUFAF7 n=1 Tax=Xylona heveae (strain CBS 132557 / TC161) TaxID=1328760 RepID=A0A165GXN7_XYLHT|nr:DUF185-domain-containing protein [Xylona heveae TC161]KZF22732.1 DUF185-domain-containing protein [Xylona heveae TC161]
MFRTLRVCRHQAPRLKRLSNAGLCIRWNSVSSRKWSTPLAKQIAEAIQTTGPISLAAYMRQCLTSPDGGYYTSKVEGRDQFGQKGDFITSPEISQTFGELLGIWIVAEWMAQGRKGSGVELIELGPGRGTLMDDVLRTLRNFQPMVSSVEAVYLVEASPTLREAQKRLLCGDAPMEAIDIGYQSTSKYSQIPVIWCEDLRFVPKGNEKAPFILAHEFFDALPIHVFQSVSQASSKSKLITSSTAPTAQQSERPQWREMLVSPTPPSSTHEMLSTPMSQRSSSQVPEFQLTVSEAPTRHSAFLPGISKRYSDLLSNSESTIEICPEGLAYAQEFARRIGGTHKEAKKASGAALIIDYGPSSTIPVNSLRGIQAHRTASPFTSPGQVDLSADVDFMGLAEAALKASPDVEVHGPVEQGSFLLAMGIKERAEQLMQGQSEDSRKRIESGWKRLVERGVGGMGRIYKAMAIVPFSEGKRRPVGFGGDI